VPRPAAGDQVLLPDAGFILEPDLETLPVGMALADLCRDRGEFF
jgi:hypothetical protein